MSSGPEAGMASINRSPRWSMCEGESGALGGEARRCNHRPGSPYFRSCLSLAASVWTCAEIHSIYSWRLKMTDDFSQTWFYRCGWAFFFSVLKNLRHVDFDSEPKDMINKQRCRQKNCKNFTLSKAESLVLLLLRKVNADLSVWILLCLLH